MHTPSAHRTELIERLFASMDQTKRVMHAQLHAILGRMVPISRAQLELLTLIHYARSIRAKDIARQLYMTPGAVSQLAEGLAEQGLIIRRTDEKDRRIQWLEVTQKGESLLQDVEMRRREIMQPIFQELTDEELEVWIIIQQKLVEQFQSALHTQQK
ncbi:MAG TPA: MarR family transcriptional regulator [Candidatus Saccharimonadales bacterium]|nr:MarR family transcriptional regulator [Candidatus Saccharimonadales bacterium]